MTTNSKPIESDWLNLTGVNAKLKSFKILLVDDCVENIAVLAKTLKSNNLDVSIAKTGEKALELATKTQFDLFLLDIMLPGIDGFEICRVLKGQESTKNIPIIFISSLNDPKVIEKGFSLGCADYIKKPFISKEVCARVLTHLSIKKESPPPDNNEDQEAPFSGMKVLLVDDVPGNLKVLSRILKPEQLELSIAQSGEKALEISSDFKPDLILMDVMMPGLNGFETCRIIQKQDIYNDPAIIFLTAKETSEDIEEGFSAGCVDYIIKPFKMYEVRSRVRAHLKIRKQIYDKLNSVDQLKSAKEKLEKRIQEEKQTLEASRSEAEKANQAKSEFLAHITHELRTPLNSILGFSQLMQMDTNNPLSPTHKTNVGQIMEAGDHLLQLIKEVLDISQIESGQVSLNLEMLSVKNMLAQKILPMVQPLADERSISIQDDFPDGEQYWVFSDPMRLKQVLINLVSNAIKYNKDEGSIFIEGNKTAGDRVLIQVRDTGRGIAEEELEDIFKPFYRANRDEFDVQGSGVGLAVTRHLIELMGGSISVESTLGVGTCFTVELPSTEP